VCARNFLTFLLQVIESLFQQNTTPLIVIRVMCTFLQINWTQAVNQYKGLKRAAAKRGLDASDCTVARKQ
jgi:hypothetical protein